MIGLVHSYLPYVILTSYLALQAIDDSLIEAARSLGAPFRTILLRLILPLSLPGLAAGAVLIFVPVAGRSWSRASSAGGTAPFMARDRGSVRRGVQLAAGRGAVLHSAGRGAGDPRRSRARCCGGRDERRRDPAPVSGRVYVGLVLFFLYAPILVMALMSFNASEFYALAVRASRSTGTASSARQRGDPRVRLAQRLDRRSSTTVIATVLGTAAALALFRYEFPGKTVAAGAAVSADCHSLAHHRHGDADLLLLGRHRTRHARRHPRPCGAGAALCDRRGDGPAADLRHGSWRRRRARLAPAAGR